MWTAKWNIDSGNVDRTAIYSIDSNKKGKNGDPNKIRQMRQEVVVYSPQELARKQFNDLFKPREEKAVSGSNDRLLRK